jgi:hypothetical protein
MWIRVDDDKAAALLAVATTEPAVLHFQERVRHYQEACDAKVEARFREAAVEFAREGELEVDHDACVSMGDAAGAYVMAWWWITNEEAGFPGQEGTGSEELKLRQWAVNWDNGANASGTFPERYATEAAAEAAAADWEADMGLEDPAGDYSAEAIEIEEEN